MAMPSLEGQSEMNPFLKDFSNHVPKPTSIALQILAKKFEQASNCPLQLGLSDCAT